MAHTSIGTVDPAIFDSLQVKIDEDTGVRDAIKTILQDLEKQARLAQATLAKAHSTPAGQYSQIIAATEPLIADQVRTIARLAATASQYPYYKYNSLWSREVQGVVFYVLFCGWLGGALSLSSTPYQGRLLSLEEVGAVLGVPVNLKDGDADVFHLTIEEYLHGLISLIDELARLAINAVVLGDFEVALGVSRFVKDVHAGFQILNLKNDALRRRSDSIKYSVKKVEDVVYDLSLRNLIPKKP